MDFRGYLLLIKEKYNSFLFAKKEISQEFKFGFNSRFFYLLQNSSKLIYNFDFE